MTRWLDQVRHFLLSQYAADGLRIALSILLPALVLAQFERLSQGVIVSLGAVFVSIPDSPGPVHHRRNAMLITCLSTFLISLLTGFLRTNVYALGVEITLVSFFFSMLTVYGMRASAIGTASLLSVILVMARGGAAIGIFSQSLLILAGGLWFMGLSLLFVQLRPYRPAQQALGESIREIARFLRIKALFYDTTTDFEPSYRALVAQQIQVSEKQDAVRELLFKNSLMVDEPSAKGRALVLLFVEVVDLYEQIMAMYYDYRALRERFGPTGILTEIAILIRQLADELDTIGLAISSNVRLKHHTDFSAATDQLAARLDSLDQTEGVGNTLVLRKILVNILFLTRQLHDLPMYARAVESETLPDLQFDRFVDHKTVEPKVYQDNLALDSSVFRHSLRVAIACLVGFVVGRLLPYSGHSYWILLTITVILKPGFSLTKERNQQRLIGTIGGGLLGVVVLLLLTNNTVLFILMLLFMYISYSVQRINYQLMVFFLTPYLLILFRFMGAGFINIAEERVVDTFIGSVIAFLASYLLFPQWESGQVPTYMASLLQANRAYLQKLLEGLSGQAVPVVDYKLARKAVYVSSANLSAAFQRMIAEPKSKQEHQIEVHEFIVLNHILSANIATVASMLVTEPHAAYPSDWWRPVRRALATLTKSLQKLGADAPPIDQIGEVAGAENILSDHDATFLKEQLAFIQQISHDIERVTDTILKPTSTRVPADPQAVGGISTPSSATPPGWNRDASRE